MVHGSVLRRWQRIAIVVLGAALSPACAPPAGDDLGTQSLADREAIERVLARANLGFELSDPDLFANAFAPDAVYELASDVAVFGYQKLRYDGRDDIRTIVTDRLERSRNTVAGLKTNVDIHMSAVGRYEDELVKRDGDWLIAKRTRIE